MLQRLQISQVPSVAHLSDAALLALAPRFWAMAQDASFVQWCQGLGVQPLNLDAFSN